VTVQRTFYCDGPECGDGTPLNIQTHGEQPPTFITTWENPGYAHEPRIEKHFCCWDCCMKYAARFQPPEIIPFGESAGEGEAS
jgi:hypothetical protein